MNQSRDRQRLLECEKSFNRCNSALPMGSCFFAFKQTKNGSVQLMCTSYRERLSLLVGFFYWFLINRLDFDFIWGMPRVFLLLSKSRHTFVNWHQIDNWYLHNLTHAQFRPHCHVGFWNGPYNLLARILDGHGGMSENGVYGIPWYPKIGYTSSTAQGGGGSFKDRKL